MFPQRAPLEGHVADAEIGRTNQSRACKASGTAKGRVIKALNIVDDATHEAVAISGYGVARVLGRLELNRGLQQVIRTDNGKEFYGKAMVAWAYARRVQLRLIR